MYERVWRDRWRMAVMGAIEMTAVAICAEHGSCELPTFSRATSVVVAVDAQLDEEEMFLAAKSRRFFRRGF